MILEEYINSKYSANTSTLYDLNDEIKYELYDIIFITLNWSRRNKLDLIPSNNNAENQSKQPYICGVLHDK